MQASSEMQNLLHYTARVLMRATNSDVIGFGQVEFPDLVI